MDSEKCESIISSSIQSIKGSAMPHISLNDSQLDASNFSAIKKNGIDAIDIRIGNAGLVSWDKHLQEAQDLHKLLEDAQLRCAIACPAWNFVGHHLDHRISQSDPLRMRRQDFESSVA